jgi:hypothetical protein
VSKEGGPQHVGRSHSSHEQADSLHHDLQPMRRVVVCVFQSGDVGKDLADSDANISRSLDPDIDVIGKCNDRCAFALDGASAQPVGYW